MSFLAKSRIIGLGQSQENLNKYMKQYSEQGFSGEAIYEAYKITQGQGQYMLDVLLNLQNKNAKVNQRLAQSKTKEEEYAMQQAIKLSIQQQSSDDTINLEECLRKNDDPVGLANIGNTCYFNVVIQSLYQIKEVRDLILKLDIDKLNQQDISQNKKNQIQLLKEFQILFAQMLKGKKSFAFPKKLFQTFQLFNDSVFKIGEQADFLEFQNTCFELIEQCFEKEEEKATERNMEDNFILSENQRISSISSSSALSQQKEKENQINPINQLFFGESLETLNFLNDKDGGMQRISDQKLGIINLEVKQGEFYKALENSLKMEIDEYTTNEGDKTSAQMDLKIKKPPQIMNFYINRMQFNKKSLEVEKLQTEFTFEKEIYIDHFMTDEEKSDKQTEEESTKLAILDRKIKRLQQVLDQWDQYGENNLKLDHCLSNVIDFLSKQNSSQDNFTIIEDYELGIDEISGHIGLLGQEKEMKSTIQTLLNYKSRIQKKKEDIEDQIQNLKKERKTLLNQAKKFHYELFSILIHDGGANSGHYYCYTYDDKKQCWWKFNDRKVTLAQQDEIFKEAFGQPNSTKNACCLFYRNVKGKVDNDKPVTLSARLKQEINLNDQKFLKEIDHQKIQRAMEGLKIKMDGVILNHQRQLQNKGLVIFGIYSDFNNFLLSEPRFSHLGNWNILNEIISQTDLNVLKEALINKSNFQSGIDAFYSSLYQKYNFSSQVLSSDESILLQKLKEFHGQFMEIYKSLHTDVGKIHKNREKIGEILTNLVKIKFQIKQMDQTFITSTDFGKKMQQYIDYLLKSNILRGCFMIDLNFQVQKSELNEKLVEQISDLTLSFFYDSILVVQQVKENLENSSQSNKDQCSKQLQTIFKNSIKQLSLKNTEALKTKGTEIQQQLKLQSSQLNQVPKTDISLNQLSLELETQFKSNQETLDIWRKQLGQIRNNSKVISQQVRLEEEILYYFNE